MRANLPSYALLGNIGSTLLMAACTLEEGTQLSNLKARLIHEIKSGLSINYDILKIRSIKRRLGQGSAELYFSVLRKKLGVLELKLCTHPFKKFATL
jgi:hypothetical protein